MIKALPSLLVLLVLTGCDATEPPQNSALPETSLPAPGPNPVRVPPAAPPIALPAPADLVGEWRVAGINGNPLQGEIGIAVTIDATTFSYEPRCLGFAWDYSYARGEVELKRAPSINQPIDGVPPPICLVAVPPELRALSQALDHVTSARRTSENGVLLLGGGHSVTLFSQ